MLAPEGLASESNDKIKQLTQWLKEIKGIPHIATPARDKKIAVLYVDVIKQLWENPLENWLIIENFSLEIEHINDSNPGHAIEPKFSNWVVKLPETCDEAPPGNFAYCTLEDVTFENLHIDADPLFFKFTRLRKCILTGNTTYACQNFETTLEKDISFSPTTQPVDLSPEKMAELYRDHYALASENEQLKQKIAQLEHDQQISSMRSSSTTRQSAPRKMPNNERQIKKGSEQTIAASPTPLFIKQVNAITPTLFSPTTRPTQEPSDPSKEKYPSPN